MYFDYLIYEVSESTEFDSTTQLFVDDRDITSLKGWSQESVDNVFKGTVSTASAGATFTHTFTGE